jgi:hypothetical protein
VNVEVVPVELRGLPLANASVSEVGFVSAARDGLAVPREQL